jgi:hypothetical protein
MNTPIGFFIGEIASGALKDTIAVNGVDRLVKGILSDFAVHVFIDDDACLEL